MTKATGHGGKREGSGRKPPDPSFEWAVVKIDRMAAVKAAHVARYQGKTMAAYLTEVLTPIIDRDYREVSDALDSPSQPKPINPKPARRSPAKPSKAPRKKRERPDTRLMATDDRTELPTCPEMLPDGPGDRSGFEE
jgi:hypothetical protein